MKEPNGEEMLKLYSKVTPKVGNCFIWIGVIYTEMY
jgi:hypothetical protein